MPDEGDEVTSETGQLACMTLGMLALLLLVSGCGAGKDRHGVRSRKCVPDAEGEERAAPC